MLCLGRNLITVFRGVNTFAQLFSAPLSGPDGHGERLARPHHRLRPGTILDGATRARKKHRENVPFLSTELHASTRMKTDARTWQRPRRAIRRLERELKNFSGRASDFASHKPECAELRKLFRLPRPPHRHVRRLRIIAIVRSRGH
jgi:hypothetical protein